MTETIRAYPTANSAGNDGRPASQFDDELESDEEDRLLGEVYYSSHPSSILQLDQRENTQSSNEVVSTSLTSSNWLSSDPVAESIPTSLLDSDLSSKMNIKESIGNIERGIASDIENKTGIPLSESDVRVENSIDLLQHHDAFTESEPETSLPAGVKMRYFIEPAEIVCRVCGGLGHIAKECADKKDDKCYLCGETGHRRQTCPSGICYNCGQGGHQSRDCQEIRKKRKDGSCYRCFRSGHNANECPDIWRKYFTTLEHVRSKKSRKHLNRYCYQCGRDGHFGDDCPFENVDRYAPRHCHTAFHDPESDDERLLVYMNEGNSSSITSAEPQNSRNSQLNHSYSNDDEAQYEKRKMKTEKKRKKDSRLSRNDKRLANEKDLRDDIGYRSHDKNKTKPAHFNSRRSSGPLYHGSYRKR